MKNLVGQRFGRLIVISFFGERNKYEYLWICKCDCGNITHPIIGSHLKDGHTQSCGCYMKDRTSECSKEFNSYKELVVGIGTCFNTKGIPIFIFDWDDVEILKPYCWYNDGTYSAANLMDKNGTKIRAHRLIISNKLKIPIKDVGMVDHINRNREDNRKSNLRIVNDAQNSLNSTRISSLGVRGIIKRVYKSKTVYVPSISMDGESTRLGEFENFDDAMVVRLNAEKKYYGDFAPQKHLFQRYGIE